MSGVLIATLLWAIWVELWLPQENGGICMGPMDELWMLQVKCGIGMGLWEIWVDIWLQKVNRVGSYVSWFKSQCKEENLS